MASLLLAAGATAQVHPGAARSWRTDTPLDYLIPSLGEGPFDPLRVAAPNGQVAGSLASVESGVRLGPEVELSEGGWTSQARVNWQVLDLLDLGTSQRSGLDFRLGFPLPEGGELELALTSFDRRGDRRYTWIGQIAGVANSHVILVRHEDALRAIVQNSNPGGRTLEIRSLARGHVLVDVEAQPLPCGGCSSILESSSASRTAVPLSDSTERLLGTSDPSHRVDILVVATDTSRGVYGSPNAFVADAYAMQADTNNRLSLSGGSWSVRVVAAPWDLIAGYADSGDFGVDLPRLANSSDGLMDAVHSQRDDFRPDLIALIAESGGGGIAYLLTNPSGSIGSGYSVNRRAQAVSGTFAHEIGHNMGSCHNDTAPGSPGNPNPADCPQLINGTDRGISRTADVPDGICGGCEDTEFYTTMSYQSDSSVFNHTRVERFSVSGLTATLNGSLGSDTVNLWAADAQAMATFNVTRSGVSGYNIGDTQVWAEPGAGGAQSGTWQEATATVLAASQIVLGGPDVATIRARAGAYAEVATEGGPVTISNACRIVPEGGVVLLQ